MHSDRSVHQTHRAPRLPRSLVGAGLAGCAALSLSIACAPVPENFTTQERLVGERLQAFNIENRDQGSFHHVALFDHSTNMIHQFDLSRAQYERGIKVDSPSAQHWVLYHPDGNYIVDIAAESIAIYGKGGEHQRSLAHLQGKPQSAAFRPRLGLLALYDSTNALTLLKLSDDGQILGTWTGGPVVDSSSTSVGLNDLSLVSADINESGQLIAALSDNSISILDFQQSLETKRWKSVSRFSTALSRITWLAPVRGMPNLVLLKDDSGIHLLNLITHAVQSSYSYTSMYDSPRLSKSLDPHFIVNDGRGALRMGYVALGSSPDGSSAVVQTRLLNLDSNQVTSSRLNLVSDSFSIVLNGAVEVSNSWVATEPYNDTEVISYRFSDLLSVDRHHFPSYAMVKLLEGQIFALFPSALGHAVITQVPSGQTSNLDNFNVGL